MIYIVGTNHELQHTARPKRAIDRGIDAARVGEARGALQNIIRELARTKKAGLIAEEMSAQVLNSLNATSNVKAIADGLEVEHRFCDPDVDERRMIGLPDYGTENYPPEEKRVFHEKREAFWLDKLRDKTDESIVFVCGAEHVVNFRVLLEGGGLPSKVEVTYFGKELYDAS